MRLKAIVVLLATLVLAWVLPLAGVALAGGDVAPYLGFPPRTGAAAHAPFSWGAFAVMSLPLALALALYAVSMARAQPAPAEAPPVRRFPGWGWLGVALVAVGWTLAWGEGLVPPGWRRHTFTPLWLGYTLVMNALTFRRSGRSLLTHHGAWFVSLFPVSAAFWWLFEHLNRFVDNWYYTGVVADDDLDYFLQATLPFSTVLPAIASTWSWLRTYPRLNAFPLACVQGHRALAWIALVAGVVGLLALGAWPEQLYAFLWLAPLALIAGLQQLLLGESFFEPLRHGDWRPVLQPALAAFVCGMFWELWNSGSAAQWHYSVPYVDRFRIFEMPLLGYAGYLPFGVECALILDVTARLFGKSARPIN